MCATIATMVKKLVTKAELSRIKGVTAAAITKVMKNGLDVAMEGKRIDINHPIVQDYLNGVDDSPATGIDPLYQDAVNHCQESGYFSASAISRGLNIGYARGQRIFKMMQAAGTDKQLKIAPPPPKSKKEPPKITKGVAHTSNTKKQVAMAALNDVESGTKIHEVPEDINAFADMTLRELIQRFGTDIAFLDWLKATKSIEEINEKRLKNAVSRGELVARQLIKNGVIDPVNATHMKLLTDGAKTINKRVRVMTEAGRTEKETEKFIIDQISSFIRPMKTKITRALKNA